MNLLLILKALRQFPYFDNILIQKMKILKAIIHDMVSGNVTNNGGTIELDRMIVGQLYNNSGVTKIISGASINGVMQS